MPLFGDFLGIRKMKEFRELRLARLKAGRFFYVTCEKGHRSEMSGVDLCRRLRIMKVEEVHCPECYEWVKVSTITDGPLMNEDQKKKQQEEFLQWEKEKEEERRKQLMADNIENLGLEIGSYWP
jgi:hypothetical protein